MGHSLVSVVRTFLTGGAVVSLPAMAAISPVAHASAQAPNQNADHVAAPRIDVGSLESCTSYFGLNKTNSSLMELDFIIPEGVVEADMDAIIDAANPVITYHNGVDGPVQCVPELAWNSVEVFDEFMGAPFAMSTVPDGVYLLVPGLGVGVTMWGKSIPDPEPVMWLEIYFDSPWKGFERIGPGGIEVFPIDAPAMYDWGQFTTGIASMMGSNERENFLAVLAADCSIASPELLSLFADVTPAFVVEGVGGELDECDRGIEGFHWFLVLSGASVEVELTMPAAPDTTLAPETSVPLVPATGSSSGSIVAVALATLFGGTVLLRVARRPRRPVTV